MDAVDVVTVELFLYHRTVWFIDREVKYSFNELQEDQVKPYAMNKQVAFFPLSLFLKIEP